MLILGKILMSAHGFNFQIFCFLSHSQHDYSFEIIFKILIFSFEKYYLFNYFAKLYLTNKLQKDLRFLSAKTGDQNRYDFRMYC